ncbi:hypothetical protein BH10PSE1_BH10PSE1_11850 [soil metagenome]
MTSTKDQDGPESERADLLRTRHIDVILGRRLRDHREAMRLAREQVGEVLGVSVQRIKDYEDGNRIPASRLWQFCARYGIEVETLFVDLPHHLGPPVEVSAPGMAEDSAPFTRTPADELLAAIGAAATDLNPVERYMALAALRGMAVRKFKKP